jgi:hypothetical protein
VPPRRRSSDVTGWTARPMAHESGWTEPPMSPRRGPPPARSDGRSMAAAERRGARPWAAATRVLRRRSRADGPLTERTGPASRRRRVSSGAARDSILPPTVSSRSCRGPGHRSGRALAGVLEAMAPPRARLVLTEPRRLPTSIRCSSPGSQTHGERPRRARLEIVVDGWRFELDVDPRRARASESARRARGRLRQGAGRGAACDHPRACRLGRRRGRRRVDAREADCWCSRP